MAGGRASRWLADGFTESSWWMEGVEKAELRGIAGRVHG